MASDKDVWEDQYLSKGTIWRGSTDLPFRIKGPRVLELGCGNGKTMSALISSGVSPVCLDISRNALMRCKPIVRDGAVYFVEGDVTDLPFKDGSFNSVVCFHILEHLTEVNRAKAAREVARVLSPGGMLYVQAFSVRDMRYGKGEVVEDRTFIRGDGIRYHYFEDGEIEELFSMLRADESREKVLEKRYHGRVMRRAVFQIVFEKSSDIIF
ncbi:MAG: class I SAM-dependent methyltransferase [Methanomassiliicoccales archaeon]|nr:MAG: class I SAM-dependent methyltransferase [Methanomassiliicoccales archaeon]